MMMMMMMMMSDDKKWYGKLKSINIDQTAETSQT